MEAYGDDDLDYYSDGALFCQERQCDEGERERRSGGFIVEWKD